MTKNLIELVNCIQCLTSEEWLIVFAATKPRLIECNHDDKDNAGTKVLCEMETSNLLFDIRDYVCAQNEKRNTGCPGCNQELTHVYAPASAFQHLECKPCKAQFFIQNNILTGNSYEACSLLSKADRH